MNDLMEAKNWFSKRISKKTKLGTHLLCQAQRVGKSYTKLRKSEMGFLGLMKYH